MSLPILDFNNVAALANASAHNLAKDSLSNTELREALYTTKLANGVRIGIYDIIQYSENDNSFFSVRNNQGKTLFSGLLYYDTARIIVTYLNRGKSNQEITRLVRYNAEMHRAVSDIYYLEARLEQYEARGETFRAYVQEDRLGVLRARCRYLRQELVCRRPSYL